MDMEPGQAIIRIVVLIQQYCFVHRINEIFVLLRGYTFGSKLKGPTTIPSIDTPDQTHDFFKKVRSAIGVKKDDTLHAINVSRTVVWEV